jgi:hypothetical protein
MTVTNMRKFERDGDWYVSVNGCEVNLNSPDGADFVLELWRQAADLLDARAVARERRPRRRRRPGPSETKR